MKTLDEMLSRHLLIREQHADPTQPPGAGRRTLMRAVASRAPLAAALAALAWAGTAAAQPNPAGIDWQALPGLQVARTETTVGQFSRFAQASNFSSRAERAGGGQVYAAGWEQQPGWTWRRPFGGTQDAGADEPAVHVAFDEAQAFCRWAGGRLPTDAEWVRAAYTEQRAAPPAPFTTGTTYPYPTGASPAGAQCLADCGPAAQARAIAHGAALSRGHGHARAGSTPAGVNGLHDMGANAWEWVDEPPGTPGQPGGRAERRTRGGSWWYGAAQMRADHLQSKPGDTAVVYIGFRCVRSP